MNDDGTRSGSKDNIAIGQVLSSTTSVFAIHTIAVVGIDNRIRRIGRYECQTLVGGYPDAAIAPLNQTSHIVGRQAVGGGHLPTFVLGLVIDVDTTTIGGNPKLQAGCQQMGDKGVDISNPRRRIVQFLDDVVAWRYQLQSEGRTHSNLSCGQLGDGLHIVHIIIIGVPIGGLLHQIAIDAAHPQVAVLVVEGGKDVVVGQWTVAGDIDISYPCLVVQVVDALAIGRYQQSAIGFLAGAEHHRSLTAMLP